MIAASEDELLWYLVDLGQTMERYGAVILSQDSSDEVSLGRNGDDLILDLRSHLPTIQRAPPTALRLRERWSRTGDHWRLMEYGYELHHRALDYRRALHRHDVDRFVRAHDVVTHEHCESTLGVESCRHFAGDPVDGAREGFFRLYGLWLAGTKPDCSSLRCLD